jgi:ABC-type Na+ efflux pump permease subunit
MMLGAIFAREAISLPRHERHFLYRGLIVTSVLGVIFTGWLLISGIQPLMSLGDLASFGLLIFRILAPLLIVTLVFGGTLAGVLSVSHEKDRRTFELLLMTSLRNDEIVVGKIAAGYLPIVNVLAPLSVAMLILPLFGGVSIGQVLAFIWLAAAGSFISTSWGVMMGLWRDRTFQALGLAFLGLVILFGSWEWLLSRNSLAESRLVLLSPLQALLKVLSPVPSTSAEPFSGVVAGLVLFIAGFVCCGISTWRLRVWNPSRSLRRKAIVEESLYDQPPRDPVEVAQWSVRRSREVWMNPILWREIRTWAYGRKIVWIRLAYLVLSTVVFIGVLGVDQSNSEASLLGNSGAILRPAMAWSAFFMVASLAILNALAVNSITDERDGQSLELLLVSELTPWSFLSGKLLGTCYGLFETIVLPSILLVAMWCRGTISAENLGFALAGWLVLCAFVAMLGIHCGMNYSRSKAAIATSLGVLFFLFIGIVLCMLVMISFQGAFERQLPPFLVIILGGGTSLYMALGFRNPSTALTLAAFGLPFLTFFAITSFLLGDQELTVAMSVVTAYGFATIAMFIPALFEFDFATGQHSVAEDSLSES